MVKINFLVVYYHIKRNFWTIFISKRLLNNMNQIFCQQFLGKRLLEVC